jgi:hypothetical protein
MSASKVELAGDENETKKRLAEMGYEQELKRSLTMVSILGLSFAIIAVPFVSQLPAALTIGIVDHVLHWIDRRRTCHDTLVRLIQSF